MHWLRELVDVDVSAEELAIKLSNTSAAVDSIERFADGVSGVVVGRVLTKEDVPESDKLCINTIDVGDGSPRTILAGAKNFNVGDLVPVAVVGATVTTIDGPLAPRPMVGGKYTSEGMLCSAHELGISEDGSREAGILILDGAPEIGTDVASLLGLNDDVLEFEIYPNRPDEMSILGIAREVALIYGKQLRYPDTSVVEDGPDVATLTSVELQDTDCCPRYLARVIEGVSFGTSPALVRSRLSACGVRPLGNLIDATNYVLLLTGQPLHAFDLDKLAEQRIVVRRAQPGEKMTTLDDVERALDPADLVIADAKMGQALAGVMGGGDSEVSEATSRVLLESAYFSPVSISRTSRRHHLRSEASARFERGADPEMVVDAAAIAIELMRRWAGGSVAKGVVDAGAAPARRTLTLRPARVHSMLGIDVHGDEIVEMLRGLGCEVHEGNPLTVIPPSWRPDLEREIDLVEEVARLYGYENIPSVPAPGVLGGRSERQILRERVREAFLGAGYSEATLTSFCHKDDIDAIGYDGPLVEVSNPMTEDQEQLRPSLFPGLLRAAQRNIAHGTSTVRLFENGHVFRGWPDGAVLPDETEHVAFVLCGDQDGHWSSSSREPDAYDALGLIDLVLDELGIADRSLVTDDVAPLFHPGRSANVFHDGVMVARFGELRPSVAKAFDLDASVVVGGLALEPLFDRAPSARTVTALPTQPPVLRDMSMWVPDGVLVADIVATMREAGGEFLAGVEVSDEYRAEGRRSVAFALTFRAADRTLRAEEADAAREAIVSAVVSRHGVEIR